MDENPAINSNPVALPKKSYLNLFKNIIKDNKTISIVAFTIIILLLLILVVRPSIVGYTIYQNLKDSNQSIDDYKENAQELKSNLLVANTKLDSCTEQNEELSAESEEFTEKYYDCEKELSTLTNDLDLSENEYEKILALIEDNLEEKEEEIEELKQDYDILVTNVANNICCKAKVDDPKIDSYEIQGNKIVCLEGADSKIAC